MTKLDKTVYHEAHALIGSVSEEALRRAKGPVAWSAVRGVVGNPLVHGQEVR